MRVALCKVEVAATAARAEAVAGLGHGGVAHGIPATNHDSSVVIDIHGKHSRESCADVLSPTSNSCRLTQHMPTRTIGAADSIFAG